GLQRCRGDLHGVGEDLLTLLDLPDFVGDGSLFVLDLRDGVPRLRRIEDDSGTELCICERLQRRKHNGEHGKGKFLHLCRPFVAVGFRDALQRYGFTAVQRESPSGAARDGRPVACTVPRVLSSYPLGPRPLRLSASFLSDHRTTQRSPDRANPWHTLGI